MKTATLKEVAPAQPARLSIGPNDIVWQLNLENIESQSGKILEKIMGIASEAGSSTHYFDTGNVLYSKLRPYLNKVVCPDIPGVATTELVPLRPDPNRLDRRYLTNYLRSQRFVKWISNEVAGAKMPRVTMKTFWDHHIPLPPLAEQKRIAAILDAADALRAKRQESLALLDTLLQSTFLEMFGDLSSKKLEIKNLGQICSLVNGKAFKADDWSESGMPIIRIQNLNDPKKPFNYWNGGLDRQVLVQNGDLLIAWSGTPGTSFGAHIWKGPAGVLNQHIFKVELIDDIKSKEWIKFCLNTQLLSLVAKAHGGVGLKHVTKSTVESVQIPLPPLEIQRKFATIVESIERQRALQRAHLAELDALFASLQHRAFSGEL